MKKNVFCWNGLTMRKQDACEVYQEMCDEVFGKGNVTIPEVVVNNAILLHLLFVNVFASFYENLKAMLERLKVKMESADELEWLQAVVERVVDPEYGEQAYAQLVAWDVMWNMYTEGHIGLDNYEVDVLDATEGDGSPCQQAEAHKHMVMEKFGDEPVSAAVKKLNGIVLIDMVTLEGKVICHSFLNPNSCEMNDDDECLLREVVKQGDEEGICEDFMSDNY